MSDQNVARFVFPWPPSVNGYWRAIKRGNGAQQIISERGRIFRSDVALAVKLSKHASTHFDGRVKVEITLHQNTARSYDVDNYAKGVCDALTHAGVWTDDAQVDVITIRRGCITKPYAGCRVTITALGQDDQELGDD